MKIEDIFKNPKGYTLAMSLPFTISLINCIISKSPSSFLSVGFLFGLWLGTILRWIFVK